jgi:hypothetical protein
MGMHEGTPFGRQSFSYWDEKALVQQTLRSFDGQELEIVERLSISPDCTKLSWVLELSSGGRTVNLHRRVPNYERSGAVVIEALALIPPGFPETACKSGFPLTSRRSSEDAIQGCRMDAEAASNLSHGFTFF